MQFILILLLLRLKIIWVHFPLTVFLKYDWFFLKYDKILERNCISLLKTEPINFELAKYCFTRSKFFHLLKNDHTLGLSMQKLVNIFDKEFEDAYKMHYNWVDMLVCALRAWSGIKFSNHQNLQAHLTFIKTNCQQFKVTFLIQNLLTKIIVDFTLCTLCVNLNFSPF